MKSPEQRFRLDGRVAVVTGASSGMGVTFARALAAAGARVVVAARRARAPARGGAEIERRAAPRTPSACDVSREADVERLWPRRRRPSARPRCW